MLLRRVEIENFGPYKGKHEVLFGGTSEELVIVHGENMAGKTSLLNAIRWCLYGVAKDRTGDGMPVRQIINSEAFGEGTRRVGVELTVLDDSSEPQVSVCLRRQCQAKQGVADPINDKDFAVHLDVDVDGNILPADQFDDTVNALLPERISRFFLFDGELLKEYEELVREDSGTHAREVKRAIEMILGVPAVQNGKDDLRALGAKASRAYNKEARKVAGAKESAQAADRLQDEVERSASELEGLEKDHAAATADLTRVREELGKNQHLAASAQKLAQIESRLDADAVSRRDKLERRRDLAKDLWRDVLEPRLKHDIEMLERERDSIGEALQKQTVLLQRKTTLEAAIRDKTCEACGQEIPEERRTRTRVKLQDVDDQLDRLSASADLVRHDSLGATIRRLRDVAPAGVASGIEQLEVDIAKLDVDRVRLERERDGVQQDLKGFDPDVATRFERDKERLLRHIGDLESAIDRTSEELGRHRTELREYQRKMDTSDQPKLEQIKLERDLFENAAVVFEASISDLTNELRGRVEAEASSIFRRLTTDDTYQGLQINENYGLSIVGSEGNVIEVRSAGAEQIVALSLIGALNRLADKRGPVIMDTPFGRLDRTHRHNIMKFVPTLADQVALLVHSGEIDPERDLEPVKGKITAEYEIRHVASTRSEIGRREA